MVAVLLDNFFRTSNKLGNQIDSKHQGTRLSHPTTKRINLLLFATWVSLNQPNAPLVAVAEKFLAGHPENPLAPFLDQLTSDFDSAAMLIDKIDDAFDVLDTDGTERVDFSKLAEGLFRYNCASSRTYQRFSEQAWAHLTQNGSLCFDGHALDRRSFRMMMLEQIRMFIQSKATDALRAGAEDSPATSAQLMILKFMCIETSMNPSSSTISLIDAQDPHFLHR